MWGAEMLCAWVFKTGCRRWICKWQQRSGVHFNRCGALRSQGGSATWRLNSSKFHGFPAVHALLCRSLAGAPATGIMCRSLGRTTIEQSPSITSQTAESKNSVQYLGCLVPTCCECNILELLSSCFLPYSDCGLKLVFFE